MSPTGRLYPGFMLSGADLARRFYFSNSEITLEVAPDKNCILIPFALVLTAPVATDPRFKQDST
jgi:hypothetical protein